MPQQRGERRRTTGADGSHDTRKVKLLQNVNGINLPAAQASVTGATLYTTNGFVLLDVPNHPVHHCASNDAAMSTRPTRCCSILYGI